MKAEEEIKQIFGYLKNLVEAHREMGLEPPFVSNEVQDFLKARVPETCGESGRLDDVESLEELRSFVGDCRRCKLYRGRSHLVFGEGSPRSEVVFVGEAPGREEDTVGRPFVGKAGGLLTKIIRAMGLAREEVYICNVVKCRPPKNRDPEKDEVQACISFLKQQLTIIRPGIICALGRIAGQSLLGEDFKITEKCGKWHSYMDIPVMPTYHPAYLLRNPSAKRQVWEDIQKIMRHLGLEVKKNG